MSHSRRTLLRGLAASAGHLLFSRHLPASEISKVSAKAKTTAPPGTLSLSLHALTPGLLRISISPANDEPRFEELGVVNDGWQKVQVLGPTGEQSITWGKYTLVVGGNDPLRISAIEGSRKIQEIKFNLDSTDVRFDLDGPIFGLGEGSHPLDRRGTRDAMHNGQNGEELKTFGARLPIPWIMSPKGWGIFIGQPSGAIDFTQTEATFRNIEATATRNVYLAIADSPAGVLREYAALTGFPHLPPLWSFGYQQSHRTLENRDEILSEVRTFRNKKLPCDAMIYLGTGFCPSGWNTGHGSFTFNKAVFPDPGEMFRKIHEDNMKVILHVVPPGDFHGTVDDSGSAAKSSGDAVGYWAKHAEIAKKGVDGWWPDEGDRLSVYNRFDRNRMYWEGSRQIEPTKRPFALHRNGYAGLQRYGWLWSGDTWSTWAALRAQILGGINVGLSGIPYWGTDTGGFVPTPEYGPELWVRWFQFSTFCPSFRSHGRAWKLHLPWGWNLGTTGPKEVEGNWAATWPPEADLHRSDIEEICRKYLDLRYQLLPYIYSTAAQAHMTGMPMIRGLFLVYPHDEKTHLIDDSYLWGDSILVAPIYERGATQRSLYLPEGTWWNYWTNQPVQGGKQIIEKVTLESIPVYVRAGAIIPIGPIKQYTGEPDNEPTTLHIYPGASGSFVWYDDDGSTFQYEKGDFMRTTCEWDDGSRVLTLTLDKTGKLGSGRQIRASLVGTSQIRTARLGHLAMRLQF